MALAASALLGCRDGSTRLADSGADNAPTPTTSNEVNPSRAVKDVSLNHPPSTGLIRTSIVSLLATPERYAGKTVRVHGFVRLEFEGDAIYLHKEDFDQRLTSNAIWL